MRKASRPLCLLISAVLIASCGGGGGPGTPDRGPNGPQGASKLYVSGAIDGSVAQIASYTNASFTSGALAAARVISGAATKLNAPANGGPRGIAGDAINDRLFAVNIDDNSILVFDGVSHANGNVAPSRAIVGSNTLLDTPVFLFLDVANDRLYVSNFGLSRTVLVFDNASAISGNVTPTRVIAGFTLQLFSTLTGIQVDASRNILYVADLGADAIYVLDNADTVNGPAVIASRVITGVNTTLLGSRGMALDAVANRLYVTSQIGTGAILVFDVASTLNGNVAPNRAITTTDVVFQPASLYLDTLRNRIYLSNPGLDTLEYINNASSANGTVAPTAVATLTGVLDPFGVFVDTRP